MSSMILSEYEKKILLALKKQQSIKELAGKTGMKEDTVSHAAGWLFSKGLVKIHEKIEKKIELGEEGFEYLKKGFPERRVLQEIREKEKSIQELSEKLGKETVKIALVWLRKQNLAMMLQGKISITLEGKKFLKTDLPQEKILKLLSKGKKIEKKIEKNLKELEKRGKILKVREVKERLVELTDLGRKEIKKGIKIEKEVSLLTPELIISGNWRKVKLREYDVKAPVPVLYPAKKQMYKAFLDEVRQKTVELGYTEAVGPLVELEFWNFDALFQAQNHPAREVHTVYYLKKPTHGKLPDIKIVEKVKAVHENGGRTGSRGWRYTWDQKTAAQLVLRSQTTAVTVKGLLKPRIPLKLFSLGKNFRPDVVDAQHLPEFYQLDCIIISENVTFTDLLGILKEFSKKIAGIDEIKFVPHYFPFTEPSVEVLGKHPKLGWIELGGAGLFRPEVTIPLGINVPVLAWAFGVDRLAMFKLGFNDIRDLYSKDLDVLRKAVV